MPLQWYITSVMLAPTGTAGGTVRTALIALLPDPSLPPRHFPANVRPVKPAGPAIRITGNPEFERDTYCAIEVQDPVSFHFLINDRVAGAFPIQRQVAVGHGLTVHFDADLAGNERRDFRAYQEQTVQKTFQTAAYLNAIDPFALCVVRSKILTPLDQHALCIPLLPRPYCDCEYALQKTPRQLQWLPADAERLRELAITYGRRDQTASPSFDDDTLTTWLKLFTDRFWSPSDPAQTWVGPMCAEHYHGPRAGIRASRSRRG
jgi:hypothetical protein